MRGTPQVYAMLKRGLGLIPTYAGNTRTPRLVGRFSRAHPHVCGEHGSFKAVLSGYEGSSPRMRGTLIGEFPVGDKFGLIPTYAGNTCA